MASKTVPIILGTGIVGDASDPTAKINTPTLVQEYVSVFRAHGHTTIDTSRRYSTNAPGTSEALLGTTDIAAWATIDTKVLSNPGDHSAEKIAQSIRESLAALKIPKIHIEYCHYPDRTQSLETVCSSMAKGIADGKMEHWGVSNYSIQEVQDILRICKGNSYPAPIVYQGHYNALSRKMEGALLPVLREANIAFYAYSPAAGGSFSKNSSRMSGKGQLSDFTRNTYGSSDALTNAIAHVQEVAAKNGLNGHEVALRWVMHHSALDAEKGDAMIVGASSPKQLDETLKACAAGPLPEEVAAAVNGVWANAKATAPEYSPFLSKCKW